MPQIEQDIVIDASAEKVWTVLGERFGDIAPPNVAAAAAAARGSSPASRTVVEDGA